MQKEKSIGRNILIVVLILVTIASVCAGLFAWAKYQTTINGTATGETAKWSFKVSDGDTSTQEIEFPMTRTDNNTSVAEGKIAPGTFGELEIGIDATGTETALTYTIEAEMTNKPTNLKFYSDSARTQELTVLNGKFNKGGYMKLNEAGAVTEKIYWNWPFETGTTESQIEKNDEIDTQDSSKVMSMNVTVSGKQVNGNPVLADLVQVGDYVNYDASSNGVKTFASSECLAGTSISAEFTSSYVFDSNAKSQWRVINVDNDSGRVELVAVEPTVNTVTLFREAGNNNGEETGFSNGKDVLDDISAIYGHGKGAVNGRSIKLNDIEQYSNYDKKDFVNKDSGYSYGEIATYTTQTDESYAAGGWTPLFHKEIKDLEGNVIGYEKNITNERPITLTNTFYWYLAKNYFTENIHNMLFSKIANSEKNKLGYWIADQQVSLFPGGYVHFSVCNVIAGKVGAVAIYDSKGRDTGIQKYGVMPIVILENNIQTTGQDANGVWQLDVE